MIIFLLTFSPQVTGVSSSAGAGAGAVAAGSAAAGATDAASDASEDAFGDASDAYDASVTHVKIFPKVCTLYWIFQKLTMICITML